MPIGCAQAGLTIDSSELQIAILGARRLQEDPYDFDEREIPVPGIIDAGHQIWKW